MEILAVKAIRVQASRTGYETGLTSPTTPVLSVRSVSKRFGSVQALDDVSLKVLPGEVHAVLGENGAGKSTLVGVLGGSVRPDSGSVVSGNGASVAGDPGEARRCGIQTVHQHFMLVPAFSVAENLALATMDGLFRPTDLVARRQQAVALAGGLGWSLDPQARTGDLPVGARQRVELLKALSHQASVLILDEPTAVLSESEVEDLLVLLRRLAAQGTAVVLIAHKLSEVLSVADRITVLRHGKTVGSALRSELDETRIADWMVGETIESPRRSDERFGEPYLTVDSAVIASDQGQVAVQGVTFTVRAGEILGIGGVDGNGQVELAEALVGVRRLKTGSISGPSEDETGYVPQDRQTDGLAANLSILANTMIGALDDRRYKKGPLLDTSAFRQRARDLMKDFDVRAASENAPVAALSGGNRQKVLLARVLSRQPRLLVVVNPTRGLDIRATAFVHSKILETARAGTAVVLVSTDTDELSALADSTVYLGRGRLYATLREATA